jgi:hypothetical protein
MNLESDFPRLLAGIDEEITDVRELVVIDVNYDDVDSDEFDVFDPSDYNFLVYVTERVQEVLGEQRLKSVLELLEKSDDFKDFYINEIDMYGVMTDLEEEEIAKKFLEAMEASLS